MSRSPYEKRISQFLPLSTVSARDADRHYRRVHTAFARRVLRGMPHVISYHINRAGRRARLRSARRQLR